MDAEDAMELKLTWEEAQELLRPAPTAKPTIEHPQHQLMVG